MSSFISLPLKIKKNIHVQLVACANVFHFTEVINEVLDG